MAGITRYLETPYKRNITEPASIWCQGNVRLLDYGLGVCDPAHAKSYVLFVPSLINRYYILDLEANRSLLRYLAKQDIYPLVLDWGAPGKEEAQYGIDDYVNNVLLPVIDFLYEKTGEKIALGGYCMGGVLSLAAAQLAPKKLSSLSLFATPWDFHCSAFSPFVLEPSWQSTIASLMNQHDLLPAEAVQSLFYLTDPWVFENKFRRFFDMKPDSRAAKDFIALERWVNDGIPMTSKVAQDCLVGWAQQNRLMSEGWKIMDQTINPHKLDLPTFMAIPKNDHVVPYDCAWPLAEMIKNATIIHPSAGHVGMMVGAKAKSELWNPLADWLSAKG
ncbi:MAG: alpha/beta fold hydrolase [Rickettsiales bacterium]